MLNRRSRFSLSRTAITMKSGSQRAFRIRNNILEGCFHIKVAALRWLLLFFKLTCMPLLLQYYVFTALHRIFAVLTIVSEYWQALLLLSLCNHIRTRNRLSIIWLHYEVRMCILSQGNNPRCLSPENSSPIARRLSIA